mmetsp:Transcript_25472/g.75025  ORF Transcript_25472/g.75025 Transcript_25472/m.75025 type:complete len:214 (-) Transcript_25472:340-981(-)
MQPRNRIYLSDFSNWRAANFLLLLGRIGRWAILLSLLVTSIVIDFFLVATLLRSVGGNNTASERFLLILIFILAFILNIAIVDVFQLLCLKSSICAPHQNHATECRFSSRIFGCFSCMLNYCLKFVSQTLFGIKLKEDDTEVDATSEWEGRLDYIEEQTSKIVRESEHRINQKVKESERRIRECDLAAKVEIKKDIRNVLQAVVKHRDEDDYS